MVDYESTLRATIRRGRRSQDPDNPQKFFYQLRVPNLPEYNTHIEAVVLFRFRVSEEAAGEANNYVVTAYPTELR